MAYARIGIIGGILGEETQANTDSQGRFKFGTQLNPGSKLYAVGGGAATSTSIVLIDQHHLDITLDVPSAECSGNIVDDVKQPVAGAEITLYGERDNFIVPFDRAKSDTAGRFHFSGVYPGMPGYLIKIQKPGFGIHVNGTPVDEARKFVKQKGLTYPVFMDTLQGANAATFPAKGVPQLYVISAAGKIVCDTHDVAEAVKAVEAELKQRQATGSR